MPRNSNILHLHLIVFIWGFTAIIGKLISLNAVELVWYRMFFTVVSIYGFILLTKKAYKLEKKVILHLLGIGALIAFHWVTFFLAIKVANVSITLAGLSTSAFFVSIIEPLIHRRKPVFYEMLLGIIVVIGIYLILDVEGTLKKGLLIALVSASLSALFSVLTSRIAHKWDATVITFYQMIGGVLTLSFIIPFMLPDIYSFPVPTGMDLLLLIILATVCTAYTFIAVVKIMKSVSAFTVVLTINFEPIYGIILAFLIFGESESMSPKFYLGTLIIVSTVFINTYIKNRIVKKKIENSK